MSSLLTADRQEGGGDATEEQLSGRWSLQVVRGGQNSNDSV